MGYRFQSEYLYDRKIHNEMLRGAADARPLTTLMNLMTILVLVGVFVFSVLAFDFSQAFSQYTVVLSGLYLFIVFLRMLSRLGGGLSYKRIISLNDGEVPVNTIQFHDGYVLSLNIRGNDQTQLSYDQFRGIIKTRNMYLLTMKHKMILPVDRRTLTRDSEDFMDFLFFKCDNIRHKRVRSTLPGKLIRFLKYMVILALLMAAVLLHPRLDLEHRLAGQIHNGMSGPEIVDHLKKVGITGIDRDEAEISADMWSSDLIVDYSKLEDVMYYEFIGSWDEELERMVPTGVNYAFCHYWANDEENMYSVLLEKLDAMSKEIIITDIQEAQLLTGEDIPEGFTVISFCLNGTPCSFLAEYDLDVYDPNFFHFLSDALKEAIGKQLYFKDYQQFGTWLFLGTESWATDFQDATGWMLSADYTSVMPEYYY